MKSNNLLQTNKIPFLGSFGKSEARTESHAKLGSIVEIPSPARWKGGHEIERSLIRSDFIHVFSERDVGSAQILNINTSS